MRKSAKLEVRCTPEEKARWKKVAGDKPLSEWLRDLATDASQPSGEEYARERIAELEKESQATSDGPTEVAVPSPVTARPRVTPSRAPIERRPFRPDFK